MSADVGPAAEGARIPWEELPEPLRAAVGDLCGSPVVSAVTQPGGFSPGAAVRVVCADAARWFVKAISADLNAHAYDAHLREAEVLAGLAPLVRTGRLPAPLLYGTVRTTGWASMVIADIDGRQPALPWRRSELSDAVAAIDLLAEVLTPSPIQAPAVADDLAGSFHGWRTLAGEPGRTDGLDGWSLAHLDELAAIEAGWPEHAAGTSLLHVDLRADNLLLTTAGAVVVDWAWACVGSPLLDAVGFAPSVAMQGGPSPQELLAMTAAGRDAAPESVLALACAVAGYFTEVALTPPDAGLPTVRAFQAAQGRVARRWVAELLG